MPLPDDAFAKGKSAYKLIQYAGAKLPSLGAAVGENCQVIQQGKTGFLCETPEMWCDSLKQLYNDAVLRSKMSGQAQLLAENWSIAKHAARIADFIFHG